MIKIAIIIILILLLVVTLYSYYCLSSKMINFEKSRLEYILKREEELNHKEQQIKVVTECSSKNDSYQEAIKNINGIIEKLNLPPGSICQNYNNDKDKQTINNIKSIILHEKSPQNQTDISGELIDKVVPENIVNIYHEVPTTYIETLEIEQ
jgi:hypothetical protein